MPIHRFATRTGTRPSTTQRSPGTKSCRRYCAQASTHGIARFAPIAVAGPLLAAELDGLGRALETPARPLVAIVGGAKVSTKLSVLETLAESDEFRAAKVLQLGAGAEAVPDFIPPYERPSLTLFSHHVSRLAEALGLGRCWKQGRARSLHRSAEATSS